MLNAAAHDTATSLNNIPQIMRDRPNWVARQTDKIPVNVKTGKSASSTNPDNWATFADTCKYIDSHYGKVIGAGFVLTLQAGIVGIDIDHCLCDGNIIDSDVQELVSKVHSYMETSPSGDGLHIYVKGSWHKDTGSKMKISDTIALEVYPSKRYFTITGQKYAGSADDVTEQQELLDYIWEKYFLQKLNTDFEGNNSYANISLEKLPENIESELLANAYFKSLWDGERPKEDESSDDMALTCQLVKLLPDDNTIKAVFLQSPHFASKDQKHKDKIVRRQDYFARTLAQARKFIEENQAVPDDLSLLEPLNNDDGNAERLIMLYGSQIKYSNYGEWYAFADGYWQKGAETRIRRYCLDTSKRYLVAARQIGDEKLVKAAVGLGNEAKRKSMIAAAEIQVGIDHNEFNTHSYLLPVNNGIVNLQEGTLLDNSPSYNMTFKVQADYNPDAPEPKRFCQFLREICCGDEALEKYLLRILGYCVTGETKEQKLWLLHGSGSNGKSVLVQLLERILGADLVGTLSQDALLKRKNSETNPSLVQVKDVRIALVNESNKQDQLDAALVKTLSGGDSVKIRTLYKEHISLRPRFKMLFITNHLPNIDWSDKAMERRIKVIPFNGVFTGDKCDPDLLNKLLSEKEGILSMLVKAAKEWYAYGLGDEPPCVLEALVCVKREDSVYAFIADEVDITGSEDDMESASNLYARYDKYCFENGFEPDSTTAFGLRLASYGLAKQQKGKKRLMTYIGIRPKHADSIPPSQQDTVA